MDLSTFAMLASISNSVGSATEQQLLVVEVDEKTTPPQYPITLSLKWGRYKMATYTQGIGAAPRKMKQRSSKSIYTTSLFHCNANLQYMYFESSASQKQG